MGIRMLTGCILMGPALAWIYGMANNITVNQSTVGNATVYRISSGHFGIRRIPPQVRSQALQRHLPQRREAICLQPLYTGTATGHVQRTRAIALPRHSNDWGRW